MDIYLHTIEQIQKDLDQLIQEWILLKLSHESSDKAIGQEIQDLEAEKKKVWSEIEHLNNLLQELYDEESDSVNLPHGVRPS